MRRTMALLVLYLTWNTNLFAEVQISVPEVTSPPGSSVLVPVLIVEGGEISAIQFVVRLHGSWLSRDKDDAVFPGDELVDHDVVTRSEEGSIRVLIFSATLTRLKTGTGSLVQIVLRVGAEAPPGERASIELSEVYASNVEGERLDATVIEGGVTAGPVVDQPGENENELVFPQIANGSYGGGSFGITMVFLNPTGVTASGRIRLFKSDGSPFPVRLVGGGTDSTFTFLLPPGGSLGLQSDGSGSLTTGYGRLNSTAPLGATLVFANRDSLGDIDTEAGVGPSPPREHFFVPVVFELNKTRTGIAVANLGDAENEVTFTLKDRFGKEVGEKETVTLEPGQHYPRFADEIFPNLKSASSFLGSLEVSASAALSAIALKQQGTLLTTFPIVGLDQEGDR